MTSERDALVNSISDSMSGHHDTIYCTKSQRKMLLSSTKIPSFFQQNVEQLRFMGLDVQTLPRIDRPIVCQKGEVFDLAKDYKNGEV